MRPVLRDRLTLQKVRPGEFALVPPKCAVERGLDIDEVHEMIAEEEPEAARDELLFLVEDCHGFVEAHNLLAELALQTNDVALARGHFGYAYENVLDALPEGFSGRLPTTAGYNAHFFACGCGLARCLVALQQNREARDVLNQLHRFDPDNADVRALIEQLDDHERSPPSSPLLPIL